MGTDWAYPDRTGESIESSGAEILSLDQAADEQDVLQVEQDGIGSLRDTEAEQGDEAGLRDQSFVDRTENEALGAKLDRTGQPEPNLD
jgi:hypothetical protein